MKAKNKWGQREKYILEKILHLRRQPLSGAGIFAKEDAIGEHLFAQLKSTEGESIKIQRQDVQMLFQHAQTFNSLFVLDFVNGPLLLCMTLEQLVAVTTELVNNGSVSFIQEQQAIEEQTFTGLDQLL